MEQNGKPRNKPPIIWPINLQQSRQEDPMGKRQALQQTMLRKLNNNMQKNETGPCSYTIHKNKFKWFKDLNVRQKQNKTSKC